MFIEAPTTPEDTGIINLSREVAAEVAPEISTAVVRAALSHTVKKLIITVRFPAVAGAVADIMFVATIGEIIGSGTYPCATVDMLCWIPIVPLFSTQA